MQFDNLFGVHSAKKGNGTPLSKTNFGNNFDGHYTLNKITIVRHYVDFQEDIARTSRTILNLNFSRNRK